MDQALELEYLKRESVIREAAKGLAETQVEKLVDLGIFNLTIYTNFKHIAHFFHFFTYSRAVMTLCPISRATFSISFKGGVFM